MADIKSIIPFTYKWEGGLSRATTDTASKNAAPWPIADPKDGKLKTGWHTNKGITYPVFKSGSKLYGYADTADNFTRMPEDIWLKIAKGSYWDKIYLDQVKSQVVANFMFSWMWGSGYGWRPRMKRYFKTKGIEWDINNLKGLPAIFNQLTDKYGEKAVIDELIQQKKEFLLSLNQPANEKGWLRRLEDFRKFSYDMIGKAAETLGKTVEEVKKKPLTVIVVTALGIVSIYVLVTVLSNNKKKTT